MRPVQIAIHHQLIRAYWFSADNMATHYMGIHAVYYSRMAGYQIAEAGERDLDKYKELPKY